MRFTSCTPPPSHCCSSRSFRSRCSFFKQSTTICANQSVASFLSQGTMLRRADGSSQLSFNCPSTKARQLLPGDCSSARTACFILPSTILKRSAGRYLVLWPFFNAKAHMWRGSLGSFKGTPHLGLISTHKKGTSWGWAKSSMSSPTTIFDLFFLLRMLTGLACDADLFRWRFRSASASCGWRSTCTRFIAYRSPRSCSTFPNRCIFFVAGLGASGFRKRSTKPRSFSSMPT
mmetsp:Transcript_4646/g.29376  ORF Transcript_4646/g.29376 Transcript_4646/m.29376 type:complete len:232 (-) Transcript_4646:234-929(-)